MADTITTGSASPSKMATEAVLEHEKTGGSTFNTRNGKNMTGSRNVVVGMAPEHSHVLDHPPTAAEHDVFTAQVHHILAKHSNAFVGTHHDEETGLHHLEVVGATPSKLAALRMAQHLGENHAYNLATDEKYSTGNFGQPQPSHMGIDERFEKLRADSPKRAPYHGTHFSNRKLDKIQGAHRGELGSKGAGSSNSDHNRINAGTKAGHGMDAPGGFYTVAAGAAAPALEAQKAHAYTVRGRFAFGTTDMPEFKNGYAAGHGAAKANGADDKTAHHLGLNNAEHALQDAGFDGYLSPKHPAVRFHFGDADAEPVQSHKPMEAEDVKPKQQTQKLPEGWHSH